MMPEPGRRRAEKALRDVRKGVRRLRMRRAAAAVVDGVAAAAETFARAAHRVAEKIATPG
jgi:hypothetical protein